MTVYFEVLYKTVRYELTKLGATLQSATDVVNEHKDYTRDEFAGGRSPSSIASSLTRCHLFVRQEG